MRVRRYALQIRLDASRPDFSGSVALELEECTNEVRLDAEDLTVRRATLDGRPAPTRIDSAGRALVIDGATPGKCTLRIEYEGRVPQQALTGVYRSVFGPQGSVLTSMMYPTGARRLLPCLEHPAQKAIYEVEAIIPADQEVIFNTAPESSIADGRERRVRFAPTPPMSAYLLYIAVGPFEVARQTHDGVEILVATPPGRSQDGAFALAEAGPLVAGYSRYYGLPYPLPKLHLVAVPDFWAGAMENWGAIAFRENVLLVDHRTTTAVRRAIRTVLAHEIAHQWFGDLVTMAWWNDFWLNESFATYMEAKMLDFLQRLPEAWSEFLLQMSSWGYFGDALETTHSIDVPIDKPEQIGQIADAVSYGKGASVLRMIDAYLGDAPFREGVSRYLKRFAYANARGQDLWESLQTVSGQPVASVMSAWVRRPGHPVVSVTRENGNLALEQQRFLLSGSRPEEPWPIPLVVEVGSKTDRFVFDSRSAKIPLPPGVPWRLNPERQGFFRVRYSDELLGEIASRFSRLPGKDRWGILEDLFAFALSGEARLSAYLEFVERCADDAEYIVTHAVADRLFWLRPLVSRRPEFARAERRFFRGQMARLGEAPRPGEPETLASLRHWIALGRVRADPEYAHALAERWPSYDTSDPDIRPAIAVALARDRGAEALNPLLDRFLRGSSEEESLQAGIALAELEDAPSLGRAIEYAASDEIPLARGHALYYFTARNPLGPRVVWPWTSAHAEELARRWSGTPLLGAAFEELVPYHGLGREEDVRSFFATHAFPEADRSVAKALELLGVFSAFVRRENDDTGRPAWDEDATDDVAVSDAAAESEPRSE